MQLDNLEIDPEVNTPLVQEIQNIKNGKSQWYRYEGNIKLKHLLACKQVPFDTFDSNLINEIKKKLHAGESARKQLSLYG